MAVWRGIYVKRDYLADYRAWAQTDNENLLNGVPTNEVAERHASYILKHFPPSAGGGASVLDVGCGSVTLLRKFAASGTAAQLVGTLPSTEELEAAKRILRRSGLDHRISIRLSTVTALDFSDNSFDAVYANEIFHYVDADEASMALREMKRVLRPGGLLFVGSLPDRDEHAAVRECVGPLTHLRRRLSDGRIPYSRLKLVLLTLRYALTGKGYVVWQSTPFFASPEEFSSMLRQSGFVLSRVENPHAGTRWNYLAQAPLERAELEVDAEGSALQRLEGEVNPS